MCGGAAAAAAAAPLGPARFCLCGSRRVCVRATTARRELMNARPREGDANEVTLSVRARFPMGGRYARGRGKIKIIPPANEILKLCGKSLSAILGRHIGRLIGRN